MGLQLILAATRGVPEELNSILDTRRGWDTASEPPSSQLWLPLLKHVSSKAFAFYPLAYLFLTDIFTSLHKYLGAFWLVAFANAKCLNCRDMGASAVLACLAFWHFFFPRGCFIPGNCGWIFLAWVEEAGPLCSGIKVFHIICTGLAPTSFADKYLLCNVEYQWHESLEPCQPICAATRIRYDHLG